MNQNEKKGKLIWAVDPAQNPQATENIVKELKIWSRHLNCDVLPVAVFSKIMLNLSFPIKNTYREIAIEAIKTFLSPLKTNFLEPKILFVTAFSDRLMASEMAKFAENSNALMIFANSHAKKNWSPIRLGGFAEALATKSRVPILLLNPTSKASTRIPSILFPTDLSVESKNALLRLEPFAKAFKSKITIYNQVENPNIYQVSSAGLVTAQNLNLESLYENLEAKRIKKAEMFASILKQGNLGHSLIVKRQHRHLSSDIITIAKKSKAQLIALSSHIGPIAQTILGGTVRDLVFESRCPVLIFYKPKRIKKSKPITKQNDKKRDVPLNPLFTHTEAEHT